MVAEPRRTGWWLAVLAVVAAGTVFGIVSLSALSAEASYTARGLEAEITELSYRYDELTAEVATLESPDRIRRVAVEELGMVPSEQPAYLVLEQTGPDVTTTASDLRDAVDGDVTDPVKFARDGRAADDEWEYTSSTAPADPGGGPGE